MAKKSRKAAQRRISEREFTEEFSKIVAGRLSELTPDEQDRRIAAADRVTDVHG